MFQRCNPQLTRIVLCGLALLFAGSPALAQERRGQQQRSSEIRVEGPRAQALIKTTVENFELTGLKVRCGDAWIDIMGGDLDEETVLRILEWSDWLTASGADWVGVTSTTAVANYELQKDVITAIESFSGAKADAFCSFLRELGVIGLPLESGSCPQARAGENGSGGSPGH